MNAIEYFYSAHSAYAYLGSARVQAIATEAGRPLAHRPMDLRAVVAVTGPGATNRLTPQRAAYFSGREIERWAEMRDAPVMSGIPTHHHENMTLPNCMLIAAIRNGINVDLLSHLMLQAHWRDDANLASPSVLKELGHEAGLDPAPLLDSARSRDVVTAYAENTAEAIRRSVFGSPTYFVDGDMFYGQDHLQMVARALTRAFRGSWPPPDTSPSG